MLLETCLVTDKIIFDPKMDRFWSLDVYVQVKNRIRIERKANSKSNHKSADDLRDCSNLKCNETYLFAKNTKSNVMIEMDAPTFSLSSDIDHFYNIFSSLKLYQTMKNCPTATTFCLTLISMAGVKPSFLGLLIAISIPQGE